MILSARARRACRRLSLLAFAALLAILTSQCLNHPRNGQTSPSKATVIAFDGYIMQANAPVTVYVFNSTTTNYDAVAHSPIMSSTSGYTDKAGTVWYSFSATDVQLPSGSQYWSSGPGRSNSAQVRAVANGGDLFTFDVDADTCQQTQLATGGVAIALSCRSTESPTAIVNASCGVAGGDCCVGGPQCDYPTACVNGSCSGTCGTHGQTCCQAAPFCDTHDACTGNTCQCGGNGEPCCAGGGNTGCNSGYVCGANDRCEACGAIYGICCHNGTCTEGTCVDSTPPQCACGQLGIACCSDNYCVGGNTCKSGVCTTPSAPAPTCVAVGGACGTSSGPLCCTAKNEVCNYGTCISCIPHGSTCASSPSPCCSWQDTCVIDQETGGSQCDIGDSSPAN